MRLNTDKWRTGATLMLTAMLSTACTSTSVVEKWRDASYSGPALQKLLVVAVQRSDGRRRIFEDSLVTALTQQGLGSGASYRVFAEEVPDAVPSVARPPTAATMGS